MTMNVCGFFFQSCSKLIYRGEFIVAKTKMISNVGLASARVWILDLGGVAQSKIDK